MVKQCKKQYRLSRSYIHDKCSLVSGQEAVIYSAARVETLLCDISVAVFLQQLSEDVPYEEAIKTLGFPEQEKRRLLEHLEQLDILTP